MEAGLVGDGCGSLCGLLGAIVLPYLLETACNVPPIWAGCDYLSPICWWWWGWGGGAVAWARGHRLMCEDGTALHTSQGEILVCCPE